MLLFRAFVAATLLLVPPPMAPAASPVLDPGSAVVQIMCIGKTDISAGTAFRIGNGLALSVNHVTSAPGQCFVQGKPLAMVWKSPTQDFSMLGGGGGPFLRINCGGFVKGRSYLAIGFARGLPELTTVELIGTGVMDRGQAVLVGIFSVVPGQSGGPIVDEETGAVVGVVNAENYEEGLSWSVPLSSTPLCKERIA